MVVPQDFNLPPVPFEITKYEGFIVSTIVAKLAPSVQRSEDLIGIAVHAIKISKIGTVYMSI